MSEKPGRVYFIDNLRVLLTCLVVLVHLAITYGAAGDWYFKAPHTSPLARLVLTAFAALAQAFFMGFFFLIAAYFTPSSLARKGAWQFLGDRLLRLGLPLLFYLLVLNPLVVALVYVNQKGGSYVDLFRQHYAELLGVGPMWFVLNLLLFTLVYVGLHLCCRRKSDAGPIAGPSLTATIGVALGLGVTSFLVRIWYPVGAWLPVLHLMPAYEPQYLTFFAVGILAGERGWQGDLPPRLGRFWRLATPLTVLVTFAWIGLNQSADLSPPGGLTWRSFVFALSEHVFAVGIIIVLLDWFGRRCNRQGRWLAAAAADSYTVYIIHPLVLVLITMPLQVVGLYPLAQFAILAPVTLAACFGSAHLIRKLPLARKIL